MSSITGSCSDSPVNDLFQKGIEAAQEKQRLESTQLVESVEINEVDSRAIEPTYEGVKGSLFDAFA